MSKSSAQPLDRQRQRILRAAAMTSTVLAAAPPAFAAAPGFARAANVVWFSPTVDQRVVDQAFDNMTALGIDHVSLDVWWFQNNISSTTIAPDFTRYSSTDDTIRQVIDAAARGAGSVA